MYIAKRCSIIWSQPIAGGEEKVWAGGCRARKLLHRRRQPFEPRPFERMKRWNQFVFNLDSMRVLLGPVASTWILLGIYLGSSGSVDLNWVLLGFCLGSTWLLLGAVDSTWVLLGLCLGSTWVLLGAVDSTWALLGFCLGVYLGPT